MNFKSPRGTLPTGWNWGDILRDLVVTWKLLWDPRVPGMLKLFLPVLAMVYVLSPIDLMPFLPFDDIAVALIAARLFVALAPRDSVDRAFGRNSAPSANVPPDPNRPDDMDVIDTTWRVIED